MFSNPSECSICSDLIVPPYHDRYYLAQAAPNGDNTGVIETHEWCINAAWCVDDVELHPEERTKVLRWCKVFYSSWDEFERKSVIMTQTASRKWTPSKPQKCMELVGFDLDETNQNMVCI